MFAKFGAGSSWIYAQPISNSNALWPLSQNQETRGIAHPSSLVIWLIGAISTHGLELLPSLGVIGLPSGAKLQRKFCVDECIRSPARRYVNSGGDCAFSAAWRGASGRCMRKVIYPLCAVNCAVFCDGCGSCGWIISFNLIFTYYYYQGTVVINCNIIHVFNRNAGHRGQLLVASALRLSGNAALRWTTYAASWPAWRSEQRK